MKTILITGGTGLVGKALVKHLVQLNYTVIILTRNIANIVAEKNISYALWNVKEKKIDIEAVLKADVIIHLAGAGVMDKKWDATYKKEIEESRTMSSALIIDTLKKNKNKVTTLISASAIGWYGEDKKTGHFFTEDEKADEGYLGMVCKKWEESVEAATSLGIRVCKLRTGIVLSNEGAAYVEFKKSLKFGIASILGNGNQIVSWIHIDDLCRQFIYAMENEKLQGTYNAVAPNPISNKILTLQIATIIRPRFFIPLHVPTFILKIMLGSRSIEILKSTRVSTQKIIASGYNFLYATIEEAVKNLEKK
jgi:uncharacterized protein